MHIDMSDMNVLVTGASGGIGRSVARDLAAAGARVAVHYNSNEESAQSLVAELGKGARAFRANLALPEECSRLFLDVLAKFDTIDVLVNNAGLIIKSPLDGPAARWLEDWNTTIMVNLTAAGILTRAAVNHFLERDGGRIVNIASRAAFRGETPEYIAYASAKAGLVALSRSIARNFGKKGIKSFVVAPGFVRTGMAAEFIEQYGEGIVMDDLAPNELTEPEHVSPTVVFLASGLMDHATGCTVDINAGSYLR